MNLKNIISEIDAEIERLEQAKQLLGGITAKRGPGRPARSLFAPSTPKKTRRRMSAAGRARIAAAQKARWAKAKKATSKAAPQRAGITK